MLPEKEKHYAQLFLDALENASKSIEEAFQIGEQIDPVYVYFIIRYLREKYPSSQPTSQGVVERLVKITTEYDQIVKMTREGEKDIMREWFDDSHNMSEFYSDSEKFIDLIYEKLNG